MPIIIRKGLRFADSLRVSTCGLAALFCMMICAAPIAGAEPEAVQAEDAQAEKTQGQGSEPAGAGAQDAARALVPKKKIALAQFDVANTQHVDDINNIYDGLPLALASRLEASREFLTAYTGRSIPVETGEAKREAITRIAGEAGAQFLISGLVVNAGAGQEKGYLGTSIGGYTKRHIEVELAVYDGLTGARLLLRRLDEQAQGDVRVGNDKPFGSSLFFETELGQATNRLLDLAVGEIRAALGKVPFSANIVRVEGKKVFLDAGSDSLLKPGDQLVAYTSEAAPVVGLKGSVLGVTDRAADTVTLTQVQRQFSIGELSEEAAKPGIKAGNLARIDPAEQRALEARQMEARQIARAQQEAKAEAERVKAEQAAKAKAAQEEAKQAAKAEAARIKAEKKAAAQAKAKAAAEAKAARLKARQEARAARIKAAQEARARELAREKARAAAEAKAAKLKAQQEAKAEAVRIKAEKKAQAEAEAKAAAEAAAQQAAATQHAAESGVAKTKTEVEAMAEAPPEKKKPVVPLKLKQIKP